MRSREIGKTGIALSELGFGGGGIGEFFVRIPDRQAEETLAALWEGGVRFYDTAPLYGYGLSELRIGQFVRRQPRGDFVLATKVGRVLTAPADPESQPDHGDWLGGLPFEANVDFTRGGVLRSFEDSLQRLGLSRIDLVIVHDLTSAIYDSDTLATQWRNLEAGGWQALAELREAGRIGAIGLGIMVLDEIPRFLDTFDLDVVYVVSSYTLLDQSAFPATLDRCHREGVGVVLAATFQSGILAQGPVEGARFDYRPAEPAELERVARLDALCRRHDVPMQAVAIQFPLAHPAVCSVLVGPISPSEARENVRAYERQIPAELWDELRREGWIDAHAPTPATA